MLRAETENVVDETILQGRATGSFSVGIFEMVHSWLIKLHNGSRLISLSKFSAYELLNGPTDRH